MLKKLCAVLAVVATGVLWSASANAACSPALLGTKYCTTLIKTGSMVFDILVTGLGNQNDTCPTGDPGTEECPITTHFVFGTILPEVSLPGDSCKPTVNVNAGTYEIVVDTPSPCITTGLLFCVNKALKAPKAQGTPFSLTTTLSDEQIVDSGDCTRNGRCTEETTVQATFNVNPCVNNNWVPKTFTASEMWAVSILTWIDNQGVAQVAPIVEFCKVDLPSNHQAGLNYECKPEQF